MRRLSKTAWIVLGVGIFVIAFVALYMLNSQQSSEQRNIKDNLTISEADIITVTAEKTDAENQLTKLNGQLIQLENKLAEAKSKLNSSKGSFPNRVESIEYGERLFNTADGWLLELVNFTATEPGDEEVEDIDFTITTFTVKVKGQIGDIIGFINSIIIDDYFASASVDSVNINITEEQENPLATVKLTVYSY
jgi:hypothetical protein